MPNELTRRARSFLRTHGQSIYSGMSDEHREHWTRHSIPQEIIDRMAVFESAWGGWLLPPAPQYEGGPKVLRSDVPELAADGWWFEAGDTRCSVDYGFYVSPRDEFCVSGSAGEAVLHRSVAGWIESVALAYYAGLYAAQISKIYGTAAEELGSSAMTPFAEVEGVCDTWWHDGQTVYAVYRGEATMRRDSRAVAATVYTGIPDIRTYLAT